jgi:tetratricopeptide (TPR) repeat protein
MDQVLSTAIEVLRARHATDAAKVDAFVNRLVAKARRDDPEAARRMVLEAESLEVQERFDDAIAAYKAILARDDVPKFVRATAINNLAFLLAMKKQDLDQALEGVNEAIETFGPLSDVLDTRALVYLHRGDFTDAVKDLQLAVKMGATASKYFHLAEALLGAGDEAGALAAWEKAEAKGISAKTVPGIEVEDFERTKVKIETVRAKLPGT